MYVFFMPILISTSLILSSLNAANHNPKVIVIGAGIAGLTTAYRLQQEGIDVSIYEARRRVGGRIFTAYLNDIPIELGGQNLSDGGEATHINQLIDEFELERLETRLQYEEAYFNGEELISIREIIKKRGCTPETLEKEIENAVASSKNMKEVLGKLFQENDPLYKILALKLAAYEGGNVENLSVLYAETLYHMLLGGLCAAHQINDEKEYLDFIALQSGNGQLPEKMAETLGTSIHLNRRLTKVSKEGSGFILTFHDHEEVRADYLVLAMPCSVYEDIIFEEGIIPLERLQKIQSIQYGTNAKIILPCSEGAKIPIVMDDKVISFMNNNHMLILYATGERSVFSEANIGESYEQSREMIDRGYPNICSSKKPLYARDESFVKYEDPVGYSWPNDPYVKGSYAYIAPGQEDFLTKIIAKEGQKFKELFAPIGNLYFVGEHTSLLIEVPGTIEAAAESGERIASVIVKRLNQSGQIGAPNS